MAAEVSRRRPIAMLAPVQDLLLLASEVAWIYPWTVALEFWIRHGQTPLLALYTVVVLLGVGLLATRPVMGCAGIIARSGAVPRILRAAAPDLARVLLVVLAFVAAILVGLNELPTFHAGAPLGAIWQELMNSGEGARAGWAGLVAGLLWWRGVHLGHSQPSLDVAQDEFAVGTTALATLLALEAVAGQVFPFPSGVLVTSTLAFLFTALVGVPLARVAEVNARPRHQGAQRPGLSGCWLATLLCVVGSLLLGSLLLAQLLSFERIVAVWDAISGPLVAVLTPILYVLSLPGALLVAVLTFIFSLIPQSQVRPRMPEANPDPLKDIRDQAAPISPEFLFALKVVVILAVAAVLVFLVIRALSRLMERWAQSDVEEVRESVWSWPGLGELWRWIAARLRPLRARVASLAVAVMSPSGGDAEGTGIRDLYRRFLALGAKLGRARRADETPLEYQQRLGSDNYLSGADDVGILTEGYNRVRYAPPPPTEQDPGPLATALSRLRALWGA